MPASDADAGHVEVASELRSARRALQRLRAEAGASPGEAELRPVIDTVLAANPDQIETYRKGTDGVLGFFVGQAIEGDRRQGRPRTLDRLLRKRLARG